jgi:regulatory protein
VAARLLARAPRTEAELEARLVARGYRTVTAAATVDRCRELGYVGDAAFAHDRARALRARGAGSLRIAADLSGRGLPDALVATAVEESREDVAEVEWARRALGRHAAGGSARAWRWLVSRGFAQDVITDLLGEPEYGNRTR